MIEYVPLVTSVAPASFVGNGAPAPVMTDDVDTQQLTPEFLAVKRIREQVVDTIMDSPQPRAKELVRVSVLPIMEENVEVALAEPVVDVLVPQIVEKITEVVKVLPQEPVSEATVKQIEEIPLPQIAEEIVVPEHVGILVSLTVEETVDVSAETLEERIARFEKQALFVPETSHSHFPGDT